MTHRTVDVQNIDHEVSFIVLEVRPQGAAWVPNNLQQWIAVLTLVSFLFGLSSHEGRHRMLRWPAMGHRAARPP
jgi:hypothetical protein